MSEVKAPEVEPSAVQEEKKVPRSRGKYIDFAPRRKVKPSAETPSKVTVVVAPAVEVITEEEPVEEIVEEPVVEDVIEEEPVEEEPVEEEIYEDGPMAEFNDFDDDFVENAQEDFLSSDSDDNYVEEVLSRTSETRTETTIRRSPFLKNYHVEKRPLSSHIPVRENVPSVEALPPTPRKEFKEEVFERHADPTPENAEEPVETKEEKAGSKLGMILTILVTVLLGAGVGVFVYLAFFK